MTKDIVSKLAPFLAEPIDSECKVVYLLAEARKLPERDDADHKMGSLWRREYMTKDGEIIYGGPDHYPRLTATKHFRDFLGEGRPALKAPEKEEKRLVTLQELEELVRSNEAENGLGTN